MLRSIEDSTKSKHAHVYTFSHNVLTQSVVSVYLTARLCAYSNRHGGTCYTKPVLHDLCDVVMHKYACGFALSFCNFYFSCCYRWHFEWFAVRMMPISMMFSRPKRVFPPHFNVYNMEFGLFSS